MNQRKIGEFLKQLRKEKGLTQEQLAEHFYVSSRSVSRWETGSNMPDVDMLIELANFYNVDIREIINGERKSETMNNEPNNETKDTLKKVVEYTEKQNKKLKKKMIDMMLGSVILILFCSVLFETNAFNGSVSENSYHNIMIFTVAIAIATLILNIMYLAGIFDKISQWKNSRKSKKH